MTEYHEPWDAMPDEVRDMHRALKSLQEELEAVDWYNQRMSVATDDELRSILEHNRDEEIEHAAMILEWLRRREESWNGELRTYLFTKQPITEVEESDGGHDEKTDEADPTLGIGSMKGVE